jgi:hypothetical protein
MVNMPLCVLLHYAGLHAAAICCSLCCAPAEDGLEGPEAGQGAAEQQLPVQQQEAEPRLKAALEQPEQGPPAGEQQQEEEAQQQAQQLGGPQGEQQRAAEGVAQPEATLVEGPPQ